VSPSRSADLVEPGRPGPYLIDVLWRGRDGAQVRARETRELIADMSDDDAQRAIDQLAGLEKYRIRVWPGTQQPEQVFVLVDP
jgi:hypothetical protein